MKPSLTRTHHGHVVLLEDTKRPYSVHLAFSERVGGVSRAPFDSLNLSSRCGDDLTCVQTNRRLVVEALLEGDAAALAHTRVLDEAHQVHGINCVVVEDGSPAAIERAQAELKAGADAIVCTAYDVCPLLCFADCVPLIFVAPGGFALAHSGWRGTYASIAAHVLHELTRVTRSSVSDVFVYIGPHIQAKDYPVSKELMERFVEAFGPSVDRGAYHLDLEQAIIQTLTQAGVESAHIVSVDASTASETKRFFSYRASKGSCGRHGALACMPRPRSEFMLARERISRDE